MKMDNIIGSIEEKYIIKYIIENMEPLAIGGSQETIKLTESDRKIIVYKKDNIPFIPGSSLKGVIRTYFDRIAYKLAEKFGIKIIHHPDNNEQVCDVSKINDINELFSENNGQRNLCDLCLFFGANSYGSPLIVTDAQLVNYEGYLIETRTHIRISRDLDITERGALFTAESITPHNKFKGTIIYELKNFGDNNKELQENQKILLQLLVNYLNDKDIYLGGMKSRGYGQCNFKIESVHKLSIDDIIFGKEGTCINIDEWIKELSEKEVIKND